MDKAYDAILQLKVDATAIAKTSYCSGRDQFRYKCLCCGEGVYLAAADSNEKAPHFRHRRGNNDKDCEQYLGQFGAGEQSAFVIKNKQEHMEFYFNKERMTFEISAAFSEEKIRDYEQNKNRMLICTKLNAEPFLAVDVNKGNFAPDKKQYFTLKTYSNEYCVSFSANKKKYVYHDVIKSNGRLNIYKVKLQGKRAKLQGTDLLYTGTTYIAISENENVIQELTGLKNSIFVEDEFNFSTMGVDFYGITFSIKSADYFLELFFQKNDYQIGISESLDILWPPVYTVDSDFICNNDKIYISSSFKLVSHGNTNLNDSLIQKIDDNLSEIEINDSIIIYEKNIDVSVKKSNVQSDVPIHVDPDIKYMSKYTVPGTYDYFLYDNEGCKHLIAGTIIFFSEQDRVVGYKNGHIKEIILGCPLEEAEPEKVISDILQYHPQSEKYNPDEFEDIALSEAVVSYLESCYRTGRINTVVKRYIKEGLI